MFANRCSEHHHKLEMDIPSSRGTDPLAKKGGSPLVNNFAQLEVSQPGKSQMLFHRHESHKVSGYLRSLISNLTRKEDSSGYQSVLSTGKELSRQAQELRAHLTTEGEFQHKISCKGGLILATAALLGGGAGFAFGRFNRAGQSSTDVGLWTNNSEPGPFPIADTLAERNTMKRFLPYETGMKKVPATSPPATEAPVKDDVQIKKMFDLECIKVRDTMTFADWLQTISETLSSPVTKMSEESAVVNSWNKGEGCPTAEQLRELQMITVPIDVVVSTVLGFLPGSQPLNILQGLIAPMLELMASDIKGKEPDREKRKGLLGQLIFMSRQSIPSLATSERAALLEKMQDKSIVDKAAQEIVKKRFIFKDGRTRVNIDDKSYILQASAENNPLVTDESGVDRFIHYNQKSYRWEFASDNYALTYENNKIYKDIYGLKLDRKKSDYAIETLLDPHHPDLFLLKREGQEDLKGIFINERFIPVRQYKINNQWVMTAYSSTVEPEALVLETEYGWIFEQNSVPMDHYLGLLLKSKNTGFAYQTEKRFKPIAENGFSADEQNNYYIKKDNIYYPVEEIETSGVFSANNHPTSRIIREHGFFKLESDENMLYGAQVTPIGASVLKGSSGGEYIESNANEYLTIHAQSLSHQPPKEIIRSGLYRTDNKDILFMVNDQYYHVNSYTDNQINIARTADDREKGEIILKRSGDTWVRLRYGAQNIINYKELSTCRIVRSPTAQSSCINVYMEGLLADLLDSVIARGGSNRHRSILDKNLTEYKVYGVPNLHVDPITLKYFYLYQGHYFKARITNSKDSTNPTGLYIVNLYCERSFLPGKQYIASIVADVKGKRAEIKTQETFISERLNINRDIAQKFIESRPYRFIGGIHTLEDSVKEVLASGEFYTSQPREVYKARITDEELKKYSSLLFPDRIVKSTEYEGKTFTLTTKAAELTTLQVKAQRYVKESFEYLKHHILPALDHTLHFYSDDFNWQPCMDFLSEVLGTTNRKHIFDFALMLRKRLKRINDALTEDKLKLLSIVRRGGKVMPLDETLGILTESERQGGIAAFMTDDRDGNIYINIDKTYADNNAGYKTGAALMTVLMHEASHKGSMTYDFSYIPRVDGFYIAAWEAVADLALKIRDGLLKQTDKFREISNEYVQSISVYRNKMRTELTNEQLFYLFNNDPGYRAHILINNADTLALLTANIYEAEIFGNLKYSEQDYSQLANFKALDRFGTIYDYQNSQMIKDYDTDTRSGTKTYLGLNKTRFESRAQIAEHNVNCINRLYGASSASLIVDVSSSKISISMPKLPGKTLYSIYHMNFHDMQKEYRSAIEKVISGEVNPADELTTMLTSKGITYERISLSDLMFDKEHGFSILNFDAAELFPEGEEVATATSAAMLKKIKLLIASFALYVGLPYEEVLPKLGLR
ncbi:hypothetical protein ACQYRI_15385 [Salmonella enterica]